MGKVVTDTMNMEVETNKARALDESTKHDIPSSSEEAHSLSEGNLILKVPGMKKLC